MTRVVWITGRPASGKTTLGRRIVEALRARGRRATLLDSDEARAQITPTPTYAKEERALFYRALAWTAARLAEQDVVAVVAATAHDAALRRAARKIAPTLFLVHARCPQEICEARDPKGLYRAARARNDGTMPGVHLAFDEPEDADLVVDTDAPVDDSRLRACIDAILA